MMCRSHVKPRDRIAKIRELEHFAALYKNAYIQYLENRGESNGNRKPDIQCERIWEQILDLEQQTLMQEGRIPLMLDDEVFENE